MTSWVDLGGAGLHVSDSEGWKLVMPWPGGADRVLLRDGRTTPEFDALVLRLGLDWPRALLAGCLGREPPRFDLFVHRFRAAFAIASAPELLQLLRAWSSSWAHWIGLDAAPHLDGHALIAAAAGVTSTLRDASIAEGLARIVRAGEPLPEGWPAMIRPADGVTRWRRSLAVLPQAALRERLGGGGDWDRQRALAMVPDLVDDEVWAAATAVMLDHAKGWPDWCRVLGDGPALLPFIRATAGAWKKDRRGKTVVAQDALHAVACHALAAAARAGLAWPETDDELLRFDRWTAGPRDYRFKYSVLPALQHLLAALPMDRRREVYLRGFDVDKPKTCLRPLPCLGAAPCEDVLARVRTILGSMDAKLTDRDGWLEWLRSASQEVYRQLV